MVAPTSAIRARIPAELAPLEVAPGLGIVSVMFFRYDVCDTDFYTEAAVGVAVRPAGHGGPGVTDLVASLANDHLHAYVLALPGQHRDRPGTRARRLRFPQVAHRVGR
jgi:hypothetical protein